MSVSHPPVGAFEESVVETHRDESDPHGLVCPFPSLVHPDTIEANARTLAWLVAHGMLEAADTSNRLATERYTWLAGRMFPSAGKACFQLIADFTSWIFHHDDLCDESHLRADPEAMAQYFDREFLLMQGQVPADPKVPTEVALCDVGRRFAQLAPDAEWFTRFVLNFRRYLNGCLWEAQNRRAARTPDLEEYVSLRPFAGAVWLYMEFVELVLGRRLPFEVLQHRGIQRLRRITSDLAAWHNDIYSVLKELRADDPHNLVLVLQREQGGALAEAVAQAVERCNERIYSFEEIAAAFEQEADELTSDYLDALRLFIRGAFDYLLESERYVAFTATDRAIPSSS